MIVVATSCFSFIATDSSPWWREGLPDPQDYPLFTAKYHPYCNTRVAMFGKPNAGATRFSGYISLYEPVWFAVDDDDEHTKQTLYTAGQATDQIGIDTLNQPGAIDAT